MRASGARRVPTVGTNGRGIERSGIGRHCALDAKKDPVIWPISNISRRDLFSDASDTQFVVNRKAPRLASRSVCDRWRDACRCPFNQAPGDPR
jgi:hypothetical protein